MFMNLEQKMTDCEVGLFSMHLLGRYGGFFGT